MVTTIKISKETKDRILSLDLAEKGKTFDMLVNDLITFYTQTKKKYLKEYKKYEKASKTSLRQQQAYEKYLHKYKKERQTWQKLLKWAKSQGFKE